VGLAGHALRHRHGGHVLGYPAQRRILTLI
jgi:hypothetical protein